MATLWLGVGVRAQPGESFETVESAGVIYRQATVVATTASTVTIRHADGIAQLPLRHLVPDVQARLGYDPERAEAHERQLEEAVLRQRAEAVQRLRAEQAARLQRRAELAINRVLERLGTRPRIGTADLRSDFNSLNLGAQNQGQRPSCAVFAVIGALEYEYSKTVGRVEKFSEDYLIWATRRISGRQAVQGQLARESPTLDAVLDDIGFTLEEVLSGLRAYGVPTAAEMPNTTDRRMSRIPEPTAEVVENALRQRRIVFGGLPGDTPAARVDNIIHALNEGVPVVAGFAWPLRLESHRGAIQARDRPSRYAHAVTLVGYTAENADRESVRFIFRNSWGREWGEDGYGSVELGYLQRALYSAIVLQVQPARR